MTTKKSYNASEIIYRGYTRTTSSVKQLCNFNVFIIDFNMQFTVTVIYPMPSAFGINKMKTQLLSLINI